MAKNYKNILLKDNTGKILLPITLSYYVEYKDGMSVQSYLDSLGADVDSINSYINDINEAIAENGQVQQNIINAINDVLTDYVQKPDHAKDVVFDNTTNTGLSDSLKNLSADPALGYVSTQQAIETIDGRLTSSYSYAINLGERVSAVETFTNGLDDRIGELETKEQFTYTKVNELFDSNGNLDVYATAVKYTGSSAAGTDSLTGDNANVQNAIDLIGSKLETIKTSVDGVISQAGVTYVKGLNGILVNDKNNSNEQGAVTVSISLDNDKLIYDNNKITVNDSKLSISGEQITGYISSDQIDGGLGADNINIAYSYVVNEEIHTGETTVQEFYDNTQTTLSEIQNTLDTLDNNYAIGVTSDTTDSTYARVYTITQGATSYTINIPKDQFLKDVEYAYAADGTTPALVFHWNLENPDADDVDTSYVPIVDFIDAITDEIATEVTALSDRVAAIESAGYITGVSLDGAPGTVSDGVVSLTSKLQFIEGTSTEGISDTFLSLNGISIE